MADKALDKPDRITTSRKDTVGEPAVKDTTILVERLLAHLATNPDPDDLLNAFPDLTRDDVMAVLADAQQQVLEQQQVGERASQAWLVSPEAFYRQLTSRSDIRKILTRPAK